jgi:hypothetical protein
MAASSKKSPLVQFVEARFEYLRCMHKGPNADLPEKLKIESLQGIMRQIAVVKALPVQDGITLAKMLDDGPMPSDVADQIRLAIQDKVNLGDAPGTAATQGRQMHLHLEHYQTASDWAVYADKGVEHDQKLSRMAKRMVAISLLSPTEPTCSSAVAIALHIDGPLQSPYLLAKLRRLKEFVQAMSKDLPRCDAPNNYPLIVEKFKEEFKAIYLAAYANDAPTSCPVDGLTVQFLKSTAPCRNTKAGCSEVFPQHLRMGVQSRGSAAIVNHVMQRQPSHLSLPGFKWCSGNQMQAPAIPPMQQIVWQPAANLELNPGLPGPAVPPLMALTDVQPGGGGQSLGSSPVPKPASQSSSPEPKLAPQSSSPEPKPETVVDTKPATSLSSSLSEMVKMWQAKAQEAKGGNAEEKDPDDKSDGDFGAKADGVRKRPAAAPATTCAKKAKQATTTPTTSAKKVKPATAPTKKPVFDKLLYQANWGKPVNKGARYYGSVTIYCDMGRKKWRVKPYLGARLDMKFSFGVSDVDNRVVWNSLVKHVKELKQF